MVKQNSQLMAPDRDGRLKTGDAGICVGPVVVFSRWYRLMAQCGETLQTAPQSG
jgi:hypothetical protein